MIDTQTLLNRADEYKMAAGVLEDKTVSHRVFGDSKKLTSLREGGDITVRRFNAAMLWFDQNWPLSANNPNQECSHDNPTEDRASDAA